MSAGRFIFFLLNAFFLTRVLFAQCPTADFDFPDDPYQICLTQQLEITNNSTGGVNYSWDFCAGDLANSVTATSLLTIPALDNTKGIDVVQDNGNWYAFIPSNFKLFRVDLGTDINNVPMLTDVTDLGNIGGGS